MTDRSPTDELREEHAAALAAARDLADKIAGLLHAGDAPWAKAGDDLLVQVGGFRRALLLHFRKEEEGLFPDVQQMIAEGAPRVDILSQFFGDEADDDLIAHHLLRARMRDIIAALEGTKQAGSLDGHALENLRSLTHLARELLERHIEKEHKVVFPMIERLLDEEQMAAVRQRFEDIARSSW